MRTWLQPVQFRSGPAGKPRRIHLRRIELTLSGTSADGKPWYSVSRVPRVTLCGASGIVPTGNPRDNATCRACLRLADRNKEGEQA